MTSPLRKLCAVLLLTSFSAAAEDLGITQEKSCPCNLEIVPGTDDLQWNCRDRLLPTVPTICWTLYPNVTKVDLFHNHIEVLRVGDFDGLWMIRDLQTYWSHLRYVEEGALSHLTTLEILDLGYGNLTEVPVDVKSLVNLKLLGLEYNSFTSVPGELIAPLVKLETLAFVRNHIESIPNFQTLTKLTWLDLEANEIDILPKDLLGKLEQPCQLWINDNPMVHIAGATLLPLPDGSHIRTNGSVTIWAKDMLEYETILSRDWTIGDKNLQVLDLGVMLQTCSGLYEPGHPCYEEP